MSEKGDKPERENPDGNFESFQTREYWIQNFKCASQWLKFQTFNKNSPFKNA